MKNLLPKPKEEFRRILFPLLLTSTWVAIVLGVLVKALIYTAYSICPANQCGWDWFLLVSVMLFSTPVNIVVIFLLILNYVPKRKSSVNYQPSGLWFVLAALNIANLLLFISILLLGAVFSL